MPALFILALLIFMPDSQLLSQTLLADLEKELATLIQQTKPAAVTIYAYIPSDGGSENDAPLLSFFSTKEKPHDKAEEFVINVGSGLYLHRDGYILTRSSVVAAACSINVKLLNGLQSTVDLIGIDDDMGIALLKCRAADLEIAPPAMTSYARLGGWVLVIGNSLGAAPAVSVGHISAIRENGMIQIAANIDPGHNGAPVINSSGEVIGIVTGRVEYRSDPASDLQPASNTALVLPASRFLPPAQKIVENYCRAHGWLGITVSPLPGDTIHPQISHVKENSPASRADLRPGDIIIAFENRPISNYYALRYLVKDAAPGTALNLGILRGIDTLQVGLEVGAMDPITILDPHEGSRMGSLAPKMAPGFGHGPANAAYLERKLQDLERQIREIRAQIGNKK